MRIINAVLGDATGGRWTVVRRYAETLAGAGHAVLLLGNSRHPPPAADVAGADFDSALIRASGHYDPLAGWAAGRLIRRFRADLVIAHCSRSVALLRRAGGRRPPLVAVTHSNKVRRSLPADAYFNISRHIGKLIETAGGAGKPAFYLPNAVTVTPPAPPRRRRLPVRIGAFGRYDPVKGLDLYIRALGILKRQGIAFQALLGGDGEQGASLTGLIQELGLARDVTQVGWVDDPARFFRELDMFCVPARSDAFGLTPLEAAVAGLPLVVSDAAGHRDMFQPGRHARFFPRDDAAALAAALAELIGEPQQARAMAEACYRHVAREFNPQRFAERLDTAVRAVVERC